MPWPITSLQHCLLVICSLYHFSPGGLKEISKSPPAELRIPSPIHSGAAGKPGINQRENAVNSCALFLSSAQLVVGTLPDESGAVSIHQPGSGVCIPGDGLASAGSSGAASLCQVRCGRNPHSSTPCSSSFRSVFGSYQILEDKIRMEIFLKVRPQHHRNQG